MNYRYPAEILAREPDFSANTLYVIGGLYGNGYALAAIDRLCAAEQTPVTRLFNGDFNWFNCDAAGFRNINEVVLAHRALRGNVETELASDDDAAGCGCGYPAEISDDEVERSNSILRKLRATALGFPAIRRQFAALPMHQVTDVGGLRVAIVHGDCESLAGWQYDNRVVTEDPDRLRRHFISTGARVIASSHTCLPVALTINTPSGVCALFNNGAAGMPNFTGARFGILTRIATTPAPFPALYGTVVDGVHADAIAIHYDHGAWLAQFLDNWPPGSPAYLSYHRRITDGPPYRYDEAPRGHVMKYPKERLISTYSSGTSE